MLFLRAHLGDNLLPLGVRRGGLWFSEMFLKPNRGLLL